MKIAEIPYLNCAPFYWNKKGGESHQWISVTPRELGELARKKELDAGPVSLCDSFSLEKDYEALGNLGIAVKNSAKSVLLFSKKPIKKLAGATIGFTSQTVTSLQLLKFILEGKYGIAAQYQEGFKKNCDAQLRIGDEALKGLQEEKNQNFPFIIDLGEEWYCWQKLPFVFARWMVKKSLEAKEKKTLFDFLQNNLNAAQKKPKLAIQWFEKKRGWRYSDSRSYLAGFSYEFGKEEEKAISVFKNLARGFAATVCSC